jgi:hypothetical protein
MLKLAGGVVAGGAAMALATASPAAAATGDPLILGSLFNGTEDLTLSYYEGLTSDPAFIFSHLGQGAELGPDIKAGGTGRFSQVPALGAVNSAPSFGVKTSAIFETTPAHELVRSEAGLLWASTGIGTGVDTEWKRMNTVRTDSQQGDGVALTPYRAVDTRNTTVMTVGVPRSFFPWAPFPAATEISRKSVAVMGNLTITSPTFGGWVTIYPKGLSEPATSSINFSAGQTVANFFCVGLGTSGGDLGQFTAIARKSGAQAGTVQIIVDITAYIQ